jgi:glyceraldehyde-3-phosphate dehydrogenase/erythrose-4-phosphate dehydrogenase
MMRLPATNRQRGFHRVRTRRQRQLSCSARRRGADDAIVSAGIVESPYSPAFNSQLTAVLDGSLVKVVSRCDSEWGCANRRVGLAMQVLVHAHA